MEPIYLDIATESTDPGVTEIDSLCMACFKNGTTRLLCTSIPHYKEIILMSFACEHCGLRNNSVQPAKCQEKGVKFHLTVKVLDDLKRQVVTSEYSSIEIPEVSLEIPTQTSKGEITTVEGVIQKVIDNLTKSQDQRREVDAEVASQIDAFVKQLESLIQLTSPFTLILNDISGNSFVEPLTISNDSSLSSVLFSRTKEDNSKLGFEQNGEIEEESGKLNGIAESSEETSKDFNVLNQEVLTFNTLCEKCTSPCNTNMKLVNIPYFKEVILMATNCEKCGYRTNEVKPSSGIADKGKKITLRISETVDLSRDILKSDTCSVFVPELDLYVGAGILVPKFTTVEGLLNDIKDDLKKNPFIAGDSAVQDNKEKLDKIINTIEDVVNGRKNVKITLDDPAGNCYIQDIYHPEVDPYLTIEEYIRTSEQDDELGITDMNTENYINESNKD